MSLVFVPGGRFRLNNRSTGHFFYHDKGLAKQDQMHIQVVWPRPATFNINLPGQRRSFEGGGDSRSVQQ